MRRRSIPVMVLGLLLPLLLTACGTSVPHRTSTGAPASSSSSSTTASSPVAPSSTATPASTTTTAPPCAAGLAGSLARTDGATQLITVEAPAGATGATLTAWTRRGGCWVTAYGPYPANIGANGLSPHHHEGDDTTPEGIYGFEPTMYGTSPNPGVQYPFHQLVCGDWWDEDPGSSAYNTFQHVPCGQTPPFGGASEDLWRVTTEYSSMAVVAYNTDPTVAGAGSGIFFGVSAGRPTVGCINLPLPDHLAVLRWLQPADHPAIVIGTPTTITSY